MNRRNRALIRAIAPLVLMGLIFYASAQSSTGDHAWWEVIFRKLGALDRAQAVLMATEQGWI